MKKRYFSSTLLLSSHLLLLSDAIMDKLSYVLALGKVMQDHDSLPKEERFSDEVMERHDQFYSLLKPFLLEAKSNSRALEETLIDSSIIPTPLLEDIVSVLEIKEEALHPSDGESLFLIKSKEDYSLFLHSFYAKACFLFRVYSWLVDLEIGIQDYGYDFYVVPVVEDEEECNVIDSLSTMETAKLKEELSLYFSQTDFDSDEMLQEKQELAELLRKSED